MCTKEKTALPLDLSNMYKTEEKWTSALIPCTCTKQKTTLPLDLLCVYETEGNVTTGSSACGRDRKQRYYWISCMCTKENVTTGSSACVQDRRQRYHWIFSMCTRQKTTLPLDLLQMKPLGEEQGKYPTVSCSVAVSTDISKQQSLRTRQAGNRVSYYRPVIKAI